MSEPEFVTPMPDPAVLLKEWLDWWNRQGQYLSPADGDAAAMDEYCADGCPGFVEQTKRLFCCDTVGEVIEMSPEFAKRIFEDNPWKDQGG